MKGKYKKAVIVLSIIVAVVICVNIFTYAYNGKNVLEFFWGDSDKDMTYLMEKYDYSVNIDDYTITLDSAIFDDKTECMYCMFRVSKVGRKVEATIGMYEHLDSHFGEDKRFSLSVNADTASISFTGEYAGDDLIIYGRFVYHCDQTEDSHAIYLFDGYTGKIRYEDAAAKFELKPTVNSADFSINDTTNMYISPIAIKISSTGYISTKSIEICYKDGTKEEVVNVEDRVGLGSSSASYTVSENTETYILNELTDISQIESIIYNGKEVCR